jgi:hypothetical protein
LSEKVVVGRVRPGDFLVPLKQAGKAVKFAVPVFLAALFDHGGGGVRHDDFFGTVGRSTQHADGVIVGQDDMADRLVDVCAHAVDHLARKARGCLRLDDHDAVVADDDAGVWITFGGERVKAIAHLREADFLVCHIPLRGECFSHGQYPW